MLYALSKHAALRVQQRGVPHHLVAALMKHADFEALSAFVDGLPR